MKDLKSSKKLIGLNQNQTNANKILKTKPKSIPRHIESRVFYSSLTFENKEEANTNPFWRDVSLNQERTTETKPFENEFTIQVNIHTILKKVIEKNLTPCLLSSQVGHSC
jgi:hypothetical protein